MTDEPKPAAARYSVADAAALVKLLREDFGESVPPMHSALANYLAAALRVVEAARKMDALVAEAMECGGSCMDLDEAAREHAAALAEWTE